MKHSDHLYLLLLALAAAIGCSTPATPPSSLQTGAGTCIDCHTDQATLKVLAIPDDPGSGDSGEG